MVHLRCGITRNTKFKEKIKENSLELYQHISDYLNYINLIFEIRNSVIHREIFAQMTIDNKNDGWKGSFLDINIEIFNLFCKLDSERLIFEGVSSWGLYENCSDFQCVDMYIFAKRALKEIIKFSTKYLGLLGYSKVDNSGEIFDKYTLCYY